MFRVPLRFTLHKTLLKRRVTDLLNLRGLAQVRAVENRASASLCFHNVLLKLPPCVLDVGQASCSLWLKGVSKQDRLAGDEATAHIARYTGWQVRNAA